MKIAQAQGEYVKKRRIKNTYLFLFTMNIFQKRLVIIDTSHV